MLRPQPAHLVRALILVVASLCFPTAALAGTFQIGWNGDGTITQHGFVAKTDAGAGCNFPGNATAAKAGSFPGSGGCFFLFNAPGGASIQSVQVSGHFSKATSSANLCTRSFAGIGSPDPLSVCSGGDFSKTIPVANGPWVELGIYNQSSSAITPAFSTDNANNALFLSGTVTLDDSTPPSLSVTGTVPAFIGSDSLPLHFAANDSESRAGFVAWNLDGAGGAALVADGCTDIFVCGTGSFGDFTVGGLSVLADGAHTIHVAAHSAGGDSAQDIHFATDHTVPQVVSGLTTDYQARKVSVYVQDATSGLDAVTLYADADPIPTTTSPAPGKPAGTLLVTGVIPTSQRLDGAVIDLVARDSATPANLLDTRPTQPKVLIVPVRPAPPASANPSSGTSSSTAATGATTAASATRAATTIVLTVRRSAAKTSRGIAPLIRVAAGRALRITGKLTNATTSGEPIVLSLGSGQSAQHWITRTTAGGSFRVLVYPRTGGRVRAGYRGSPTSAPSMRVSRTRIIVIPRIIARFTARVVAGGYRDPIVRGLFLPRTGASVVLAWQARRGPRGLWTLVGGLDSTIHPDARGRIVGTLRASFAADVQLRLIYLPTARGPYGTAASPAASPSRS